MIIIKIRRFPGGAWILLGRRESRRLGLSANTFSAENPLYIRRAVFFLQNKLLRRFGKTALREIVHVRIFPQKSGKCAVIFSSEKAASTPHTLIYCFPDEMSLVDAVLRLKQKEADTVGETALYRRPEGYYLVLHPQDNLRRFADHFSEYGIPVPVLALIEPFLAEHGLTLAPKDAVKTLLRYFSE